ncbi:MAG: prephenate dehydratase [Dehalococcoidales bacterium]|nr:prephenate dehydratase [Dehalococcoidales bacterium]
MKNIKSDISFLGPKGTYSEAAALLYKNNDEKFLVAKKNIFEVLESVEKGINKEGIFPIENSRVGTIIETIDYLINSKNLFINHKILIPIEACLIAKSKNLNVKDITEIISKPEAINQCNLWINKYLRKDIKITESPSTGEAVANLKNMPEGVAAIGPERAALINSHYILEKGIQDYKNNVTKFVVVSNNKYSKSTKDSTTIAFGFKVSDQSGLLLSALECFSKRNINLQKIESRPTGTELGNYIFIIDFNGHVEDKKVGEALQELRKITSLLKILGSYSS